MVSLDSLGQLYPLYCCKYSKWSFISYINMETMDEFICLSKKFIQIISFISFMSSINQSCHILILLSLKLVLSVLIADGVTNNQTFFIISKLFFMNYYNISITFIKLNYQIVGTFEIFFTTNNILQLQNNYHYCKIAVTQNTMIIIKIWFYCQITATPCFNASKSNVQIILSFICIYFYSFKYNFNLFSIFHDKFA